MTARAGNDTLNIFGGQFDSLDLSGATITGIERLDTRYGNFYGWVGLTAAQANSFTYIDGNITLTTGGTITLPRSRATRLNFQLAAADTNIDASAANSEQVNIYGNSGTDTLLTGTGSDYVSGGAGNDVIDTGSGDDRIDGGAGSDTLHGGIGNDRFDVSHAEDLVAGDLFDGGTGNDSVYLMQGAGNVDLSHVTLTGIENIVAELSVYGTISVAQVNTIGSLQGFFYLADSGNIHPHWRCADERGAGAGEQCQPCRPFRHHQQQRDLWRHCDRHDHRRRPDRRVHGR